MSNSINFFSHLIGQKKLKKTLITMIDAAIKSQKALDHILMSGPPGIGKTSFALAITNSLKSKIKFTQGPLLKTKADLLTFLGAINQNDIIFIDEIHGINKNVQELLYSAIDKQIVDIPINNLQTIKMVRLNLPTFTLIGATTKLINLALPFRERFGLIGLFWPYKITDIQQIINLNVKNINYQISEQASLLIASHSQKNPRIAKNILKRTIDICIIDNQVYIDEIIVKKTLENLGIYSLGLNQNHINYLQVLNQNFSKKWVSLELISNFLKVNKNFLESEVEPLLLENNLLLKTTRGRIISEDGQKYLLEIKKNSE